MIQKVLILDTSILCVWLKVPGKETCGAAADHWDHVRVNQKITDEQQQKTTFVLPLATIIETGNHIAQANSRRHELAQELANLMELAADEQTPWAAFTDQSVLWEAKELKTLAQEWVRVAAEKLSIGDVTIKKVAEYYQQLGCWVEILTGDAGLKSYEPAPPTQPRYRSRRRGNSR
jgi:hypothetical protein